MITRTHFLLNPRLSLVGNPDRKRLGLELCLRQLQALISHSCSVDIPLSLLIIVVLSFGLLFVTAHLSGSSTCLTQDARVDAGKLSRDWNTLQARRRSCPERNLGISRPERIDSELNRYGIFLMIIELPYSGIADVVSERHDW